MSMSSRGVDLTPQRFCVVRKAVFLALHQPGQLQQRLIRGETLARLAVLGERSGTVLGH